MTTCATEEQSKITATPEWQDAISESTFQDLLATDEEPTRKFTQELFHNFFEQASTTFTQMEEALQNKQLEQLKNSAHFLKGSSATLGLAGVRDTCEKIHTLSSLDSENGPIDEDTAYAEIGATLQTLKDNCSNAQNLLRTFYAAT